MSKIDRKIKRNKKALDEKNTIVENIANIKPDVETAESTVRESLEAHGTILEAGLKDLEDSPLKDMLVKKKEIIDGMKEAVDEIAGEVKESYSKIAESEDEDTTIEEAIEVGEAVGNYAMLNNEAGRIMKEVYDIAIGGDK